MISMNKIFSNVGIKCFDYFLMLFFIFFEIIDMVKMIKVVVNIKFFDSDCLFN